MHNPGKEKRGGGKKKKKKVYTLFSYSDIISVSLCNALKQFTTTKRSIVTKVQVKAVHSGIKQTKRSFQCWLSDWSLSAKMNGKKK